MVESTNETWTGYVGLLISCDGVPLFPKSQLWSISWSKRSHHFSHIFGLSPFAFSPCTVWQGTLERACQLMKGASEGDWPFMKKSDALQYVAELHFFCPIEKSAGDKKKFLTLRGPPSWQLIYQLPNISVEVDMPKYLGIFFRLYVLRD